MLNEIRARFHGADTVLLPRQSSTNLQTFSGALGGITAEPVTKTDDSKRPFAVAGDTFTDFADAAGRSCDNQMNSCASMANSGGQSFTVSDCNEQNSE
ncbi:hypothetical protein M406DRAFT_44477 [Cryphonectria parasitica EP155]|uniref:Uncharacterized protein n=1 Tax=Cryphonectria parasitica (strain ATCC 38755 / EP155) TaxID=660469 RepID=A0A9P4Y960_CRYP1|nr:uncharacterized protein M406DRAFT_44477 [Cryphonectria parasitica EP155]KAF3768704.1 hypothetical protein M406DRAFT_44477 [Cryphonectria parasitica EP155]